MNHIQVNRVTVPLQEKVVPVQDDVEADSGEKPAAHKGASERLPAQAAKVTVPDTEPLPPEEEEEEDDEGPPTHEPFRAASKPRDAQPLMEASCCSNEVKVALVVDCTALRVLWVCVRTWDKLF